MNSIAYPLVGRFALFRRETNHSDHPRARVAFLLSNTTLSYCSGCQNLRDVVGKLFLDVTRVTRQMKLNDDKEIR